MTTDTVVIQLDADAAKIYKATPPDTQAKIGILLSLLLREYAGSARSLGSIMDEIGNRATSLGLTEEKLKAMLDAR